MSLDLDQCSIGEKEQWMGPSKLRENSEEELLSDEKRSSSDSEEQRRKDSASKISPSSQRKSKRNTRKRKWPNEYFESDQLDSGEEWKAKRGTMEGSDSDSDPVWSPVKDQEPTTQPKKTPIKKVPQRTLDDLKPSLTKKSPEKEEPPRLASLSEDNRVVYTFVGYSSSIKDNSYDSGKFIMLKSDFKWQKSPCLWRIDGKNLLQKYEPISHEGGTAYRNISTYSSWNVNNKGLYVPIEAEFSFQSKSETVVSFDPTTVSLPVKDDVAKKIYDEGVAILDTFKIYLQTLLSQALDSNFLKEITKEKDEYFLTSISAVEEHWVAPRSAILSGKILWKKDLLKTVETHPIFNLSCVTSGEKSCDSCGGRNPTRKFQFQSRTYELETLEEIEKSKSSPHVYLLCLSCTDHVILYHQLFHIRFDLFSCCKVKVDEHKRENAQVDGPTMLKACLAHHQWTSAMHRKVLLILAETEQMITHTKSQ